ncbi:hypothetical protein ACOSQ4_021626 [Xanthoceras sorbifolium]
MGMLSTTVYVLTMDMFGPIADNAGGMVQMRQQPKSGREFSDILDAVGNTTKANLLHLHLFFFSMRRSLIFLMRLEISQRLQSPALGSFLLFNAFMDEVATFLLENLSNRYTQLAELLRRL